MKNKGFTLMETVIVVAIIAIMAFIGVVSISSMKGQLTLTELDGYAREIYLSSQNALAAMAINGSIDSLKNETAGVQKGASAVPDYDSYMTSVKDEERTDILYLSTDNPEHQDELALVMPPGSIDSEVLDGHFVIEFDIANGIVFGVFFSKDSVANYEDGGASSIYEEENRNEKSKRIAADIGYYGITDWERAVKAKPITLNPDVSLGSGTSVDNGEKLIVNIRCDAPSGLNNAEFFAALLFRVEILSTTTPEVPSVIYDTITSGIPNVNKCVEQPGYRWGEDGIITSKTVDGKPVLSLVLDSLMPDRGFYKLYRNEVDSNTFKIGDNIKLRVTIDCTDVYKDSHKDEITITGGDTTYGPFNPLFDNYTTTGNIRVSNGRHLQNLQKLSKTNNRATDGKVAVNLNADIDWQNTIDAYKGKKDLDGGELAFTPLVSSLQSSGMRIEQFSGNGKKISNLLINAVSGNSAGLFASLKGKSNDDKSHVSTLTMENTKINIDGKNKQVYVGAIAGEVSFVNITNCDVNGVSIKLTKSNNESRVGGIVGSVDAAQMTRCRMETSSVIDVDKAKYVGGMFGYFKNGTIKGTGEAVDDTYVGYIKNMEIKVGQATDIGGIVGYHDGSRIIGQMAENVAITITTSATHLGGIVGYETSSGYYNNKVRDCTFKGAEGAKVQYIGGMAGEIKINNGNKDYSRQITGLEVRGSTIDNFKAQYAGGMFGYFTLSNDDHGCEANKVENCVIATEKYASNTESHLGGAIGYSNVSKTLKSWSVCGTSVSSDTVDNIGGFVGKIGTAGTFDKCSVGSSGTVGESGYTQSSVSGTKYVGGFAGYSTVSGEKKVTIKNCYAAPGSVTGAVNSDIGGFIGYGKNLTFSQCYAAAANIKFKMTDLSGTEYHIGGFAGELDTGNSITQCFAVLNNISVEEGTNTSTNKSYRTGGFAGSIKGSTIKYCYAVSDMSRLTVVSGIELYGFANADANVTVTPSVGYMVDDSNVLAADNSLGSLYADANAIRAAFYNVTVWDESSDARYPKTLIDTPFLGTWPRFFEL